MADPRKMDGAWVSKKRFLIDPLSLTLTSKDQLDSFKMQKSASIGILPARSLRWILWRELLTFLLVAYVLLSEVWSWSKICAGLRFDCKSFWMASNCSGMSFLWAAWAKGQEEVLWLCFPCWISKVQNLFLTFLLVVIEPLISNGHILFAVAVLRSERFKPEPQYSPDQLHRI